MRTVAIIPARMGASRFPGKPMSSIHGIPMIGHCYYRTRLCEELSEVCVATCDNEIFEYIESIGGKVIMTGKDHERATDRTAEAMIRLEEQSGNQFDVVIMMQGDEPLVHPQMLSDGLRHFDDSEVQVVNLMSHFRSEADFVDKNNVKVVVNRKKDAMYFSREPIPSPWKGGESLPMYMQLGIIFFRRNFLLNFNAMEETPLERIESVDMNRLLENGIPIRMVRTDYITVGVDTPAELGLVESLMNNDELLMRYCR